MLRQEEEKKDPNRDEPPACTQSEQENGIGTDGAEHGVKQKRTILYAPTWREYESNGLCDSRFEPPIDFEQLYEVLKEENTELIIKYHYYVKEKPDFTKYGGVIRDSAEDIAELYPLCDLMITDYSSTMFDYAVLNRPMVFFAYDLERYEQENGFYFEYQKLVPGPLVRTQEELFGVLKRGFDFAPYGEKQEAFRKRFASEENGNAAAEAVNLLAAHL